MAPNKCADEEDTAHLKLNQGGKRYNKIGILIISETLVAIVAVHNSAFLRSPRPHRPLLSSTIIALLITLLTKLVLLILVDEAVLSSHGVNLSVGQEWHLLGGTDVGHLLQVSLGEDQVDFLQTALLGLGIEDVNDGQEAGVDNGEEEVRTPTNVGEHNGGDHDNEEIKEPVRDGGNGVGTTTSADGVDFGRVEPWERKPSGSKKNQCR